MRPVAAGSVVLVLFFFLSLFRRAKGTSAVGGGFQSWISSPVPSSACASCSAITNHFLSHLPASCWLQFFSFSFVTLSPGSLYCCRSSWHVLPVFWVFWSLSMKTDSCGLCHRHFCSSLLILFSPIKSVNCEIRVWILVCLASAITHGVLSLTFTNYNEQKPHFSLV